MIGARKITAARAYSLERCLACQGEKGSGYCIHPSVEAIRTALDYVKKRAGYGETSVIETCHLLLKTDRTAEQLVGGFYHHGCKNVFADKERFLRSRKRFESSLQAGKL